MEDSAGRSGFASALATVVVLVTASMAMASRSGLQAPAGRSPQAVVRAAPMPHRDATDAGGTTGAGGVGADGGPEGTTAAPGGVTGRDVPAEHTDTDCEEALAGASDLLVDDAATVAGLEHAAAVIRANCETNEKARGLLVSLDRKVSNLLDRDRANGVGRPRSPTR